ncbi:helix-turn-helix domain-containing protein [Thalassoglobus sp.]|uniref:helix-turn-helix domain-containing protein n=1 Tax=Thalassoglobus sp. TaxID=2795869 RepID=UPI003AA7B01F
MAKKSAKTGKQVAASSTSDQSLGDYLSHIRSMKQMTLREVEEATEKEVSNAYLSQLENNKIAKPSPSVLHALAEAYSVPYEKLMEKVGYLKPKSKSVGLASISRNEERHGRVATFANENLTEDEEDKLLEYLAFLRTRKGKSGSTG